jgi:hypothetical protein
MLGSFFTREHKHLRWFERSLVEEEDDVGSHSSGHW